MGERSTSAGVRAGNDSLLLISNQPNTTFRYRELGANEWREAGIGSLVRTSVPRDGRAFEFSAKPIGYIEKSFILTDIPREIRFTFMIGEREDAPVRGPWNEEAAPDRTPRVAGVDLKGAEARGNLGSGDFFSLVVGISEYRDPEIPRLRYAERDAFLFHDWLVSPQGGGLRPENVKLLTNERATLRNIKSAMFDWLAQAVEEDTVVIFFAGHGTPQSPFVRENMYLLTHDSEIGNVPVTAFPMWDIRTAIQRHIRARRIVILADACHSGGIGNEFLVAARSAESHPNPISEGFIDLATIDPGICVITASAYNQESWEGPQWGGGHGVFTYTLVEALKGAADRNLDGVVTVAELGQYLSRKVRERTRGAQTPEITGDFDPNMRIQRIVTAR